MSQHFHGTDGWRVIAGDADSSGESDSERSLDHRPLAIDPVLAPLVGRGRDRELYDEGAERVRRIASARVESHRAAARAAWDSEAARVAERPKSATRHLAAVEAAERPCEQAYLQADERLRELLEFAQSPQADVAVDAQARLQLLLGRLLVDLNQTNAELADGRPASRFTAFEQMLRSMRAWFVCIPAHWSNRLGPVWAVAGLAVTTIAAWELTVGNVGTAILIIVARMAVSLLLPPPYSIGPQHQQRTRVSFKACVAGHVSDGIMLTGVALSLIVADRTLYGTFVAFATTLMFGATLFRVGALQSADYVRRLSLERLFRNGSVLAGLAAAASFQSSIPTDGVPLLAVCAMGPAAYAVLEFVRVQRRDVLNRKRRAKQRPEERRADEHIEINTALGADLAVAFSRPHRSWTA